MTIAEEERDDFLSLSPPLPMIDIALELPTDTSILSILLLSSKRFSLTVLWTNDVS